MKYYVVLIVTYLDGTKDKVSIYTFNSEVEAIKAFYTYMGQYVGADNVATVNVEAKNNVGGIYKNESWSVPKEPTKDVAKTTVEETASIEP